MGVGFCQDREDEGEVREDDGYGARMKNGREPTLTIESDQKT